MKQAKTEIHDCKNAAKWTEKAWKKYVRALLHDTEPNAVALPSEHDAQPRTLRGIVDKFSHWQPKDPGAHPVRDTMDR